MYVTEIMHPFDARRSRCSEVIQKKIKSLGNKHTQEIVPVKNLLALANALEGRYVWSIKNEGLKNKIWKVTFVVQCHKEKMKSFPVHNKPFARQYATKILISLAAIKHLQLISTDINLAHTQSEKTLCCNIYGKPSNSFGPKSSKVLKLRQPLYGLTKNEDYWGRTLSKRKMEDLQNSQCTLDPTLFYKHEYGSLLWKCVPYSNDTLSARAIFNGNNSLKQKNVFIARNEFVKLC